ncbi:ABC transporter permease [Candidatus Sumerlaeota bacterium]|nr:ABC transporter permease [Candidatus Sumerlaeota bacterium]
MALFERFVSRRYLFSGEKKALVSVITFIAVAGVAVGVAALIIVLGVMDGAEKELFGKVIELYPQVKIAAPGGRTMDNPERALAAARAMRDVEYAEPVINKETLLTARLDQKAELVAGQLVAIDNLKESPLYRLRDAAGIPHENLKEREALLGKPLAEKLGVKKGDTILRITGFGREKANRQSPSGRLIVAGIFETGYYAFDSLSAIVSGETADKILGGKSVDYIHIKLKNPFAAGEVGARLQLSLGPAFEVTTWENENGAFFQSIKIQKLSLYLILMLIILVAGFNIIGTLILMVIEKTREIGIMKAFGASNPMIRRTFLYTGSMIGLMGTLSGVTIGIAGCLLLKYVIKFKMPPSVYNFEHLPVLVNPLTVAIIMISAMAVCVFAAFLPSMQASRLDPVEALRHE